MKQYENKKTREKVLAENATVLVLQPETPNTTNVATYAVLSANLRETIAHAQHILSFEQLMMNDYILAIIDKPSVDKGEIRRSVDNALRNVLKKIALETESSVRSGSLSLSELTELYTKNKTQDSCGYHETTTRVVFLDKNGKLYEMYKSTGKGKEGTYFEERECDFVSTRPYHVFSAPLVEEDRKEFRDVLSGLVALLKK